ncbi:MAG TPA: DMT family transporter [Sphingomicrobium sp.]|jgi:S-adenosylmethionine uptake transporter
MNRVAQQPLAAFAAALAAVALLSVMDAVMKHLVLAIGIVSVSVWRSAANLIISGSLYLPRRLPWPARKTLVIHVSRGAVSTLMAVLFFWGIGRVPLAQAIALTFIAPLIAMLLAPLFLKEKLGARSLAGALMALAGVIVIMLGQARAELGPKVMIGSLAILGSALCYSANILMMRWQALAAKPLEINFFQSSVILAIWLLALPFVGLPAWPVGEVEWVIVASLLSTGGALLFAWAYARGEASYLAVTEYSAFLWAAALGWLVFSEPVSLYTVAGALMIVGGCLVAARRKPSVPPEIEATA